jgi:hypothetical protein
MSAISGKDHLRYGELIIDTFFSRDETATRAINTLSNRIIQNVEGLSVHSAKIPLTYDTIFSPYNTLTLSSFTYTGAIASPTVSLQTSPNTSTYSNGVPTSLTAQAFFGKAFDSTAETSIDGQTLRLRGDYGLVPGAIEVTNATVEGANFSGKKAGHLAVCTVGVNSSGIGFNLYLVVQSTSSVAAADFTGTLTFTYSAYLGRKLGLPDGGTWTVSIADYASTATNTTGSASYTTTVPFVNTEGGTWNSVGNPSWVYYTIPFPYNFEMNMGRYLVLRGSLASDTQSMVWMNDEDAQNSDVIAILPVNGSYGDIMLYTTPNFEIFKLARPISIRGVDVYFTRAEDPSNTPIAFKGVDYFLKIALAISDENEAVRKRVYTEDSGWIERAAKRMKL